MSHRNAFLVLLTMFLLCLTASSIALAADDNLDMLVKQLADRKPEIQIAACRNIATLGPEAAPAGAALVEAMIRAKGNMEVWQAAADSLEKVAPKVHPHVLTIFLNYGSNNDKRYGGAFELGRLGEEGAAGLPVMKVLWSDTSKSYHGSLHAQFCAMLSVAPNDSEVAKLRQMIILGKYDRILANDADDSKRQAVISLLANKATDEEINTALLASVYGKFQDYDTIKTIVERVQKKLLPGSKAAEAYLTLFVENVRKNRADPGSKKALMALGADAASVVPMLKQLRMHPEVRVRQDVKEILDVIEQAMAVETPRDEIGDTWEVVNASSKNGGVLIRSNGQEFFIRPASDRTVVFDKDGVQLRDPVAMKAMLHQGAKLKVQLEMGKVISVRAMN